MSMLKNKKLGLWLTVVVIASLALLTILSVMAENGGQNDAYYSVTVSVNNEEYGSVSIQGDQNGEGKFRYGTNVELTATPKDSRYVFKEWKVGSSTSPANPFSFTVSGDCSYVAVFEFRSYNITYVWDGTSPLFDGPAPTTHTHGTSTKLPTVRDDLGYTFVGWKAVSGEKVHEYKIGDSLGADDYQADILLYPIFEENRYDVTCYDVVDHENGLGLGTVVGEYKYKATSIPQSSWESKTYPGYTFSRYVNLGESDYVQSYVTANTAINKVYRIYTANRYTVQLNLNATEAVYDGTPITVTYNQPFPRMGENMPQNPGNTLMGYFLDSDNDGKFDYLDGEKMYCLYNRQTGTWSYETWDLASGATLTALWEKNHYELTFSNMLSQYLTDITVKDKQGNDLLNQKILYNTELVITARVQDGYKLVKWKIGGEETPIRHADSVTLNFTILGDTVIDGLVLAELATPAFKVDYFDELFVYEGGVIPAGTYRLENENQGLLLKFSVDENGAIAYANGSSLSVSHLLGTTVNMIRCGDGADTADSDPKVLAIAPRPAKPAIDRNKIYPKNEDQTTIRIVFLETVDYSGWEFACSTDGNANEADLSWGVETVFNGLKNGTPYHVYVRVAATENAPHGEMEHIGNETTVYTTYVQDQIDKIIDWKNQGIVGDNVDRLVSTAVKDLRELQASVTFYEDANAIVKRVEDGLAHARVQDQAIADLKARYDALIGSGKYAENLGIPALTALFEGAKQSIGAATTTSQVETIRDDTLKSFDLVPISYLFVGEDMTLYAEKGMDKGYRLAMSRIVDLASINAKIQRAVNRGTIVPVGLSMTYSELQNALKTMDVLGYYQLRLSEGEDIRTQAQGPYQMKLLLPEDLRDESGFMVAYYNSVTEEMTVLETVREGNYLIFTAPQSVEDFVILGDHAVNVIPVFASLAVVFLAQIIALGVILSSRRRVRRNARLNGLALPAIATTIRFFPLPIAQATVVLAGLVILLQIILTVLVIKLDLIPRGRRIRVVENPEYRDEPAEAEDTPVEEETLPAETEEFADDSYEIEAEAEELPVSEEETVEAAVDGEDFSEESDVPNYSLAEDWFEDADEAADEAVADEEINGYSMAYDEDANGYTLEYDNEQVEYTDAEFDGAGEGFVEYEDAATYEYAEDTEATEGYAETYDETYADTYEETYDEAYGEQIDYGYDQTYGEDETEVVYDYVTAEDVIRDEDYVPEEGMDEDAPEDEFFEMK